MSPPRLNTLDFLLRATGPAPRWGMAERVLLALWFAVAAFAVAQHVPWADEEQAWLLATSVSWKQLFLYNLHYEGTGGLWHAWLKLLSICGIGFTGARWLTMALEGAGMAVLLRHAPLPRLVRWLLPFSFFLLYQDGVVARSYCLAALLAFTAATLLRSPRAQPIALAALLGLLANVSLHGALLSGALAVAAAWAWRRRKLPRPQLAGAIAVLFLLWAFAIATMLPAADVDFAAANNIHRSIASVEQKAGMPGIAIPQQLTSQWMQGLPPTPVPVHIRHGFASTRHKLQHLLGIVTFPLARQRWLALLLVACVVAQAFGQRRPAFCQSASQRIELQSLGPIGLLPYLFLVAVFTSMYLSPRHIGMVFTAFVVTLWLTWPAPPSTPMRPSLLYLQRATAGLLVVTLALQIGWTAHAIAAEHTSPYAPGKMTASFLQSQGVGQPDGPHVAGYYYESISPLLYFAHNIYENQPTHRYWLWSTSMRTYGSVQQELTRQPRFIVVGGLNNGPDAEVDIDWITPDPPQPGILRHDGFGIAPFFTAHGYHVARVFCGHSWMRTSYAEELCDTVLERNAAPTP